MRTQQNYSLDPSIVEAFNSVVESQKRSATIEQLMVEFLKTISEEEEV